MTNTYTLLAYIGTADMAVFHIKRLVSPEVEDLIYGITAVGAWTSIYLPTYLREQVKADYGKHT